MIRLTHDQVIERIPFAFICEVHEGAHWNTGRRKRMWEAVFTETERHACTRLFAKARDWTFVHGVPQNVMMNRSTYDLWVKLGDFCAMV